MDQQSSVSNLVVIREDLVKAFNQMWGKFPGPVALIHKNRMILAANEKATELSNGRMKGGVKCTSLPGDHVNCKADQALKERTTITRPYEKDGKNFVSYWVPVEDETEYYVHFSLPY